MPGGTVRRCTRAESAGQHDDPPVEREQQAAVVGMVEVPAAVAAVDAQRRHRSLRQAQPPRLAGSLLEFAVEQVLGRERDGGYAARAGEHGWRVDAGRS